MMHLLRCALGSIHRHGAPRLRPAFSISRLYPIGEFRTQNVVPCGCIVQCRAVSTRPREKIQRDDRNIQRIKLADDSFYAADASWASLGLSDKLSQAAMKAGLERPSSIQAGAIPQLVKGRDVVVAAETGSGKTHAYLLPLFEFLLREDASRRGHFALVLCPNATLCQQAAAMAKIISNHLRQHFTMAVITGGEGWPVTPPNIIIATPVAITNNLDSDPRKQRSTAFARDVRYVVFDEADMLLSGGFERQMDRLTRMLRLAEKALAAEEKAAKSFPTTETELCTEQQAPTEAEHEQQALTGAEHEQQAPTGAEHEQQAPTGAEHELTSNELSEAEPSEAEREFSEDQDSESDSDKQSIDVSETDVSEAAQPETKTKKKRQRGYKRNKQYVFVAATLPENGKCSPGAVIAKRFPSAIWVNGSLLHCHNPRIEHRWVELNMQTRVDALLEAITKTSDSLVPKGSKSSARTMVFANSVESVTAVSNILAKVGIPVMCYHRDIPLEDRNSNLNKFRREGGILICTDSAARGLDVQNITHVVQADFPLSAVDFLHRVGRTGRAGKSGLVTSLYTDASRDLVEAVRAAVSAGQPVERAFSRKRGFRKRLKKSAALQAVVNETVEDATG